MKNKKHVRWNTLQITALGFLSVIFLGGVLLYLPVSNTQPITFLDALFTSVTSVCVTGLVTVTPASQFTLFGKIILLLLIQIGGLGVIACTTVFFFLLRKKITLKERMVLQETYNAQRPGGIVRMVKNVIIGTLAVEGCGAALYMFQFVPEYGLSLNSDWSGESIMGSFTRFPHSAMQELIFWAVTALQITPCIQCSILLLCC